MDIGRRRKTIPLDNTSTRGARLANQSPGPRSVLVFSVLTSTFLAKEFVGLLLEFGEVRPEVDRMEEALNGALKALMREEIWERG